MQEIKFGILQTNKDTEDLLSNVLLNYGLSSIKLSINDENLINTITDEIKFLIIDLDFSEKRAEKLLVQISETSETFPCLTIGTSINVTPELLNGLKKFNLIYFLVKPITQEQLKIKIRQIIDRFGDHFPKRKHIRIKPDIDESMRANFKYMDKFYSSKVLDISLGGMAFEIYSSTDIFPFKEKETITSLTVNLNNREIIFDGTIVIIKGKFISINFKNINQISYEVLSKYILSKMTL